VLLIGTRRVAKPETHHGLPGLPFGTEVIFPKLEGGIRLFIDPHRVFVTGVSLLL